MSIDFHRLRQSINYRLYRLYRLYRWPPDGRFSSIRHAWVHLSSLLRLDYQSARDEIVAKTTMASIRSH